MLRLERFFLRKNIIADSNVFFIPIPTRHKSATHEPKVDDRDTPISKTELLVMLTVSPKYKYPAINEQISK